MAGIIASPEGSRTFSQLGTSSASWGVIAGWSHRFSAGMRESQHGTGL